MTRDRCGLSCPGEYNSWYRHKYGLLDFGYENRPIVRKHGSEISHGEMQIFMQDAIDRFPVLFSVISRPGKPGLPPAAGENQLLQK